MVTWFCQDGACRLVQVPAILGCAHGPTTRKGQDELDADPYFSSQFPVDMMEKRMNLRPSNMYSVVSSGATAAC